MNQYPQVCTKDSKSLNVVSVTHLLKQHHFLEISHNLEYFFFILITLFQILFGLNSVYFTREVCNNHVFE